jgi:predicted AlkP superfamily pyrophosphatase or phosphodiesterase
VFIAISFSSSDYIGHMFGPQSVEVEDTYLRLDKDIGELITYLEKAHGKKWFPCYLYGANLYKLYEYSDFV